MTKRPTSRFYRDPELAAFVTACIEVERLPYGEIRQRCLDKFGPDRTPGISAISRFYQTLSPAPGSPRDDPS